MDSRFYKLSNAKYMLYPQDINCLEIIKAVFVSNRKYESIKNKLKIEISKIFGVKTKGISYFSSGSMALTECLKSLKRNYDIKNVYIPDFSCMELADSIIKSECNLKVYDIEDNLKPSIDTIKNISKDFNSVLILPSLFGKNEYSEEFINELNQMKNFIIFDEAQTFPNISINNKIKRERWGAIISFGKSKPISGIGGGVFINNNLIDDELIIHQEVDIKSHIEKCYVEIKRRNRNKLIKYRLIKDDTKKYDSLEKLILNKTKIDYSEELITKLQIIVAYKKLKKYLNDYISRRTYNESKVSNFIFGDKEISDYNFLPIIASDKRYDIMKQLGEYKIQCTIYYYPLHLIPYYNDLYNLDECNNTVQIFENIVIVPFNIDQKIEGLREILNVIDIIKNGD